MWWSVLKVWEAESNWTHFGDNPEKARLNEAVSVTSISGTTAFSYFKARPVWITLKAALYVYCTAPAKLIICVQKSKVVLRRQVCLVSMWLCMGRKHVFSILEACHSDESGEMKVHLFPERTTIKDTLYEYICITCLAG